MKTIFNCLLILGVILLKLSMHSTQSIYTTVNGSLTESWKIHFTVFTDKLRGTILYCIDNIGNQIGLKVLKGTTAHKQIRVNFNLIGKMMMLTDFCNCDLCNETMFSLDFVSENKILSVKCNNHIPMILSMINTATDYNENIDDLSPVPLSLVNKTGHIYVMICNIGPYIAIGNILVTPMKEQIIGCVDTFHYNDIPVQLHGQGEKLRYPCPPKCRSTTCNGGVCHQATNDTITCDCSSTALNGPFCNQDMQPYIRGGPNYYEISKNATVSFIKFSWKQLFSRTYCLVEVIGFSWNTKYLMINSSIIPDININEVHFIKLYPKKGYLNIKTNNSEIAMDFIWEDITKINIGFSERNADCRILEGAYDIHFNSTKIRSYSDRIKGESIVTITTTLTTNHNGPSNGHTKFLIIIPMAIMAAIIICLIICNLLIFLNYIRKKQQKPSQTELDKVNVSRGSNLSNSLHYDKIDYVYQDATKDNSEYVPMSPRPPNEDRCTVDQPTDVYDYMPMNNRSNTTSFI